MLVQAELSRHALVYCFFRNGAERGAVADIHRRAVKLDQDLRKVHFDVHTLCVNAVTTCATLAKKFAQPPDSEGGSGESDEHSALTTASSDPLAIFNELMWKHPEHSQTTSTAHTIAPDFVWLAAAQQQQTSESSPGVLESTLKAGIDHSTQFARRLVRLGNLATRQATAGSGELEGAGGGEDGDVDADDDADVMQEPTADDAAAADVTAAAVAVEEREERSTYALAVLRRVRYKLDGRDTCSLTRMLTEGDRSLPVESKGLSVSEHVDRIIAEAIAPDNLALMYEGWAAWI